MKVSIAVPSYNYARFLDECLNSIRTQDYADYEVLIADGGSTDGSLEIIRNFCSADPRFHLVCTSDKGQSDAIVKAFSFAIGDLFCFLNADDCFICTDALTAVVEAFTAYSKAEIVSFRGYYIDAKNDFLRPVRLRYHPFDSIGWMKYRTAVLQPATFWRRIVYEALPLPVESHYTFDSIFFYQAHVRFSWLELPKPVAGHRLHGSNKSANIGFSRVKELAKFEELKFGPGSLRALYLHFVATLVWTFSQVPLAGGFLNRFVYLCVNSLSFLTFYRLPSM